MCIAFRDYHAVAALGAVSFIPGDAGMAVCFLLFFTVNPISAVCVGVFSGKNIKKSWFQPLLLAMLFLIGTCIFFDMGESAFLIYAAAYLVLGGAAMLIASLVAAKRNRARSVR